MEGPSTPLSLAGQTLGPREMHALQKTTQPHGSWGAYLLGRRRMRGWRKVSRDRQRGRETRPWDFLMQTACLRRCLWVPLLQPTQPKGPGPALEQVLSAPARSPGCVLEPTSPPSPPAGTEGPKPSHFPPALSHTGTTLDNSEIKMVSRLPSLSSYLSL